MLFSFSIDWCFLCVNATYLSRVISLRLSLFQSRSEEIAVKAIFNVSVYFPCYKLHHMTDHMIRQVKNGEVNSRYLLLLVLSWFRMETKVSFTVSVILRVDGAFLLSRSSLRMCGGIERSNKYREPLQFLFFYSHQAS